MGKKREPSHSVQCTFSRSGCRPRGTYARHHQGRTRRRRHTRAAQADRLHSTDVSLAAHSISPLTACARLRTFTRPLVTEGNAVLSTPLGGHTDFVNVVAFSPDGRTLASGSVGRTVRLWGRNVNQAIQRICATTTNTLTPTKWAQYVSTDLRYRPPCP